MEFWIIKVKNERLLAVTKEKEKMKRKMMKVAVT